MFASHDHHKVVKKIPGLHQTSFCKNEKVIVALKQLLMQLHTITAALSSSSNNADVPISLPLSDNILFVFHFLLLLLVCSYGTALKPNTTTITKQLLLETVELFQLDTALFDETTASYGFVILLHSCHL